MRIQGKQIGPGHPCYIIGEIGINHNGDLDVARRLIDVAVDAGCDAVKFQKRTPEVAVPRHQWDVVRETPWGTMSYIDYKRRIEFGKKEYKAIDKHCRKAGIAWFASPWDPESVEFLEDFDVPAHKVASASVTDVPLLESIRDTGKPVILSTGMSTLDEVDAAVGILKKGKGGLAVLHCNSTYPAPVEELNLRVMDLLRERYGVPIGYSGHETGLATTVAAVACGADIVERHITLDRAMWGTDQAASVEPPGLQRLVRDIRVVEAALGDGVKRVMPGEEPVREKLRRM